MRGEPIQDYAIKPNADAAGSTTGHQPQTAPVPSWLVRSQTPPGAVAQHRDFLSPRERPLLLSAAAGDATVPGRFSGPAAIPFRARPAGRRQSATGPAGTVRTGRRQAPGGAA